MGVLSSWFFGLVQGADFYVQLHRDAVALLPRGDGKRWFDIGCGPGLVTRLAAERGYCAHGFDRDEAMVLAARRRSSGTHHAAFDQSDLDAVVSDHGRASVVSAASLLFVVPDRREALAKLLSALADDGTLLVVETSAAMATLPSGFDPPIYASGARSWVLKLWARARRGTDAVDVAALCPPGYQVHRHLLLNGLVMAWIVCRAA